MKKTPAVPVEKDKTMVVVRVSAKKRLLDIILPLIKEGHRVRCVNGIITID